MFYELTLQGKLRMSLILSVQQFGMFQSCLIKHDFAQAENSFKHKFAWLPVLIDQGISSLICVCFPAR